MKNQKIIIKRNHLLLEDIDYKRRNGGKNLLCGHLGRHVSAHERLIKEEDLAEQRQPGEAARMLGLHAVERHDQVRDGRAEHAGQTVEAVLIANAQAAVVDRLGLEERERHAATVRRRERVVQPAGVVGLEREEAEAGLRRRHVVLVEAEADDVEALREVLDGQALHFAQRSFTVQHECVPEKRALGSQGRISILGKNRLQG